MNIVKRLLGIIGDYLWRARLEYCRQRNTKSVHNSGGFISGYCVLKHPENIWLGKNSYINGGRILASPNAKIVIGENCLISYDVHMRTDMHNYMDRNMPIREQGESERDILIGDDVWIGYGVQVMAGVTIAKGCVIAAGAVVTHDTEEFGVYAGVPARRIKERI